MSKITLTCKKCGSVIPIPPLGKEIKCVGCGHVVMKACSDADLTSDSGRHVNVGG